MKHRCDRCGLEKCIDKRFVPWRFLDSYHGWKDCPKYYGRYQDLPGIAPLQGTRPKPEEGESHV